MRRIEDLLGTSVTAKTRKVMKKQKVPRERISDGIPLHVYKRCGWEPAEKGLNEQQELVKRRQFAIENGAGKEAMEALDRMSHDYEKRYLSTDPILEKECKGIISCWNLILLIYSIRMVQ